MFSFPFSTLLAVTFWGAKIPLQITSPSVSMAISMSMFESDSDYFLKHGNCMIVFVRSAPRLADRVLCQLVWTLPGFRALLQTGTMSLTIFAALRI